MWNSSVEVTAGICELSAKVALLNTGVNDLQSRVACLDLLASQLTWKHKTITVSSIYFNIIPILYIHDHKLYISGVNLPRGAFTQSYFISLTVSSMDFTSHIIVSKS